MLISIWAILVAAKASPPFSFLFNRMKTRLTGTDMASLTPASQPTQRQPDGATCLHSSDPDRPLSSVHLHWFYIPCNQECRRWDGKSPLLRPSNKTVPTPSSISCVDASPDCRACWSFTGIIHPPCGTWNRLMYIRPFKSRSLLNTAEHLYKHHQVWTINLITAHQQRI